MLTRLGNAIWVLGLLMAGGLTLGGFAVTGITWPAAEVSAIYGLPIVGAAYFARYVLAGA